MWFSLLITMYLAFKASASQIIGHGNTSADYGGEAHYTCKLDDLKDVLQVTWQRLYADNSIENLATYSKRFGEQVNNPYKGKILFTQASLRSSSITVANLTWADESCYVCLFNAYPSGSKLHQTCLKVQGVSDVKTQVHELSGESENKDSHVVFSCSATGKPAPKIQWEYSQDVTVVAKSQTLVLTNDDQSLTSSRNLTLQLYPDWSGDVHCLINPGTRGERKQSITYTRIKNITKNDGRRSYIILIVCLVILPVLSIVVLIFLLLKRNGANMDLRVWSSGLFILMSAVFLEGLKTEVKVHVDLVVKAGEEAQIPCPLQHSPDVLQVLWIKILPEGEVIVGSCVKSRHSKRNSKFSRRLSIRGAEVQDCTLVVQSVSAEDVGSYKCLFITSSDVAYAGQIHLQTYELHGPILNVTRSHSTGEHEVSCSATGRPAPNISLRSKHRHWTNSSSVTNSNGTVTVVSTARLSHSTQTEQFHCSVTTPYEKNHVNITVPDLEVPVSTELKVEGAVEYLHSQVLSDVCVGISVLFVVLVCVCGGVFVALIIKNKQQKKSVPRDDKNMETGDERTAQKSDINNGSLRKRTPEKNEPSTPQNSSRKLDFEGNIITTNSLN
ncbi:uncharacterized protein LOC117384516 [Periophthalmus magnuspinnatus]|uniref:uncharacterized protein LOC117384516 n=1 Tax=Periophthalmus magnuspinnatus TaxID=409849 RepID=UPI0024370954|nr:uncharacterized protein LOC117384516 [Periophthalmus magnuspinnatus]